MSRRSASASVVPAGSVSVGVSAGAQRLEVRRQMSRLDPARARDDHRALDHVAQFANVAGPRMRLEQFARGVADAFDFEMVLAAELAHEVLREQRNVIGALAQRRQPQLEHVEAIEQIFAQHAVANRLRGRAVRRGKHAHVEAELLASAEPARASILENAQELGLQRDRHLGDLVEKQRAAVRELEHAGPRARGAGERALLVAEHFALDQPFGNRRRVDRDERLVARAS